MIGFYLGNSQQQWKQKQQKIKRYYLICTPPHWIISEYNKIRISN